MDDLRSLVNEEYKSLIEIRAKQTEINSSLKEMIMDHEKRLRLLERILGYGIGFIAAAKLLIEHLSR